MDCFFLSKLPLYAKALWLVLILPTLYIGVLIYYFAVYRRAEQGI